MFWMKRDRSGVVWWRNQPVPTVPAWTSILLTRWVSKLIVWIPERIVPALIDISVVPVCSVYSIYRRVENSQIPAWSNAKLGHWYDTWPYGLIPERQVGIDSESKVWWRKRSLLCIVRFWRKVHQRDHPMDSSRNSVFSREADTECQHSLDRNTFFCWRCHYHLNVSNLDEP